jgi:hypothetical protein
MVHELKPTLSNVQMELLKLYAIGVEEQTLLDLKKVMAKFFLQRLRQQADATWQEKAYSDEFFTSLKND